MDTVSTHAASDSQSVFSNTAVSHLYYFHNDASGIPEELTSVGEKLVWQTQHKTWGSAEQTTWVQHREQEPIVHAQQLIDQNIRFQGQYFDKETGLHYNTFRFYDPDLGRFISPDPIGLAGGINLYQYAPNPYTWSDPLGLAKWPCDSLKPESFYSEGGRHRIKNRPNSAQHTADHKNYGQPYGVWGTKEDLIHAGQKAKG